MSTSWLGLGLLSSVAQLNFLWHTELFSHTISHQKPGMYVHQSIVWPIEFLCKGLKRATWSNPHMSLDSLNVPNETPRMQTQCKHPSPIVNSPHRSLHQYKESTDGDFDKCMQQHPAAAGCTNVSLAYNNSQEYDCWCVFFNINWSLSKSLSGCSVVIPAVNPADVTTLLLHNNLFFCSKHSPKNMWGNLLIFLGIKKVCCFMIHSSCKG